MTRQKWIVIGFVLVIAILGVTGAVVYKLNQKEEELPIPEIEPRPIEDGFNIRLIKMVNDTQKGNYLISPYSIEIALNMLREGAIGETKEEIDSIIDTREIKDVSINNRVGIANAIFMKDRFEPYIKEPFKNTIINKYHGDTIVDPFTGPEKINSWVNEHTNGMIPNVIDNVDENFILGIANALAIDVEWQQSFICSETTEKEFTKTNGEKINVEMMRQTYKSSAKYFETGHAEGVILPYKKYDDNGEIVKEGEGKQLEFVAILPNEDINSWITNLGEQELQQIDENATVATDKKDLTVRLPRVKYDFDLQEFKKVLMTMGMQKAFNASEAEFENIISKEDLMKLESENLYIGQAIHKTAIDLNEKGTKAAAVTFFALNESNAMMQKDEKHVYIEFNKPYVYMIRDVESQEMLFFGVVEEPTLWTGSTCTEIN